MFSLGCLGALRRGAARSHGCGSVWQGTLRALQGQAGDEDVWATDIKYKKQEKALEVEFNTGERFRYPAELLRVESPAAEAPRDRQGRLKIIHGRRHVGIIGVQPVGTYAIQLQFDDMHSTGIYTWPFLHELGRHKLSRCREYIRLLRRHGLSRDPQRAQRKAALPRAGDAAGAAAADKG